VTVTVDPATTNEPVRGAEDVFAAIVYPRFAEPVQTPSPFNVIHEVEFDVRHVHPVVVVTPIDPARPPNGAEIAVGDAVAVQLVPCCVTFTVDPAMVRVPVRALEEVLAATV
jgi:hypothetical protein